MDVIASAQAVVKVPSRFWGPDNGNASSSLIQWAMLYENVELHSIAEARPLSGHGGLRLQRVPESVRLRLEEPAQTRTLMPAGAEIRFVLENERATVTLSCSEGETLVVGFFGPFVSRELWRRVGDEPVEIELSMPERLADYPKEWDTTLAFSPRVCRLALFGGHVHIHSVRGAVRPPARQELPPLRMLSYGTSITHGSAASAFHLSYVAQTARRLGTDLANYGVGGACRAEAAWGEYFASLEGWDLATLALSVNMIGAGFTLEEFEERVRHLVSAVASSDTDRPVACISIFPYFADWGVVQPAAKAPPEAFRDCLEDVVGNLDMPNVHFVPGPEILTDPAGLTTDLIHPSDLGMIEMGQNLALRLAPFLEGLLQ